MRNTRVSRSSKLLLSVMAVTLLVASILMVSTLAAPAVGASSTATAVQGDTATISVTGAAASEQVTTLVYLTDPTDANIIYIDQTAANASGEATFNFKVPAAAADGTYTVLVGSESSDIAGTGSIVVGGTDPVIGYNYYVYSGDIANTLIDAEGNPVDVGATPYVYFALTLDANNGDVAVFVGDNEIRYSPERQKYAGLIPASNFDSNMVPIGLTVQEQAPTTFVYGNVDADPDNYVDATDAFCILYYGETLYSLITDPVAADIYVDSYIDSTDAFVINYFGETLEMLPIDDYEFDGGKIHVPAL